MTQPQIKKGDYVEVYDMYSTVNDTCLAREDSDNDGFEMEVGCLIDYAEWDEDDEMFVWDSGGKDID